MRLLIKNATIFDPLNGIQGQPGNLYIRNGRMSKPFKNPDQVIDATGLWALPGGIDAGSAFTSYGISLYGFQQGLSIYPASLSASYALMGYTHLHESMMFPTTALETHRFLTALPYQDGSASLCLSLREFGSLIGSDTPPEWTVLFLDLCAQRFHALNIHLLETSVHFRESALSRFNIQASKVLRYIERLPLNLPFLIETTSRLLDEELPGTPNLYYSHIGQAIDGKYAYKQIITHMTSKGMSGDLGLIPPFPHHQLQITSELTEGEHLVAHIGLHAPLKYLKVSPPASQIPLILNFATHPEFKKNLAFSTLCLGSQAIDCYPVLFQQLFENDHSFTVEDFVYQTRLVPASLLGLKDKGHLGIGAIGDVALYDPNKGQSPGEVLSHCHTLIKGGTPVIEEGVFAHAPEHPETQTYFRSHSPTEKGFAIFTTYFRAYPRLEHLHVPETMGVWKSIPIE